MSPSIEWSQLGACEAALIDGTTRDVLERVANQFVHPIPRTFPDSELERWIEDDVLAMRALEQFVCFKFLCVERHLGDLPTAHTDDGRAMLRSVRLTEMSTEQLREVVDSTNEQYAPLREKYGADDRGWPKLFQEGGGLEKRFADELFKERYRVFADTDFDSAYRALLYANVLQGSACPAVLSPGRLELMATLTRFVQPDWLTVATEAVKPAFEKRKAAHALFGTPVPIPHISLGARVMLTAREEGISPVRAAVNLHDSLAGQEFRAWLYQVNKTLSTSDDWPANALRLLKSTADQVERFIPRKPTYSFESNSFVQLVPAWGKLLAALIGKKDLSVPDVVLTMPKGVQFLVDWVNTQTRQERFFQEFVGRKK